MLESWRSLGFLSKFFLFNTTFLDYKFEVFSSRKASELLFCEGDVPKLVSDVGDIPFKLLSSKAAESKIVSVALGILVERLVMELWQGRIYWVIQERGGR